MGWLLGIAFMLALGLATPTFTPRPEVLAPVVGAPSRTRVNQGDTLLDVAFTYGLGFEQLIRLNPEVDVWIPDAGTEVELPTWMILPSSERRGLVINVPEMRLYDFTAADAPRVLAVAIGDPNDPTPLGAFAIGRKRVDPAWNVPESIRSERPQLPAVVPPGPENPLGDRWMTLGRTSYGIHGTNNRWSIGQEATHGCVRLYNRDMHLLFERVPEGTPVRILYEPIKLGRLRDEILIEVHPDLYARERDPVASTLVRLLVLGLDPYVDRARVTTAIEQARGVPVRVGRLESPAGPASDATSGRPS